MNVTARHEGIFAVLLGLRVSAEYARVIPEPLAQAKVRHHAYEFRRVI
jgi:hypothetical protein